MAILISGGQITGLLASINNIQGRMYAEFEKFHEEVEEVAVKALKRARYERPYAFMKTGNEEQATFHHAKVD